MVLAMNSPFFAIDTGERGGNLDSRVLMCVCFLLVFSTTGSGFSFEEFRVTVPF
jgi:hypothetical protein